LGTNKKKRSLWLTSNSKFWTWCSQFINSIGFF
jgi:hypothetical protein